MNACEVLNGLRPGAAAAVRAEAAGELLRLLKASARRQIPGRLHARYVDAVVSDVALHLVNKQQAENPYHGDVPAQCQGLLNKLVWRRYLAFTRLEKQGSGLWRPPRPREDEGEPEPSPGYDASPGQVVSFPEFRRLVLDPYLKAPTPYPAPPRKRGGPPTAKQTPRAAHQAWDELRRVLEGEPKKTVAGAPARASEAEETKLMDAYDARQSRFRRGLHAKVDELEAAGALTPDEVRDCRRVIEAMRDRAEPELARP